MNKSIDWAATELDYRAGIKSLRAIAAERGISAGRIAQVAKRDGWTRDLHARVVAEAAARLNRRALNGALNTEDDERGAVEASAEAIVAVVRGHRRQIGRAMRVASVQLAELEAMTEGIEALRQLADLVTNGDDERLAQLFRRAISLSGRCSVLKALADNLKILIGLERQVFGLRDDAPPAQVTPVAVPFGPAVPTNLDDVRAWMRERAGGSRVSAP